jgi:CRISPR-associated protein (TIGR03984 family)
METFSAPSGWVVEELDNDACKQYLNWLLGDSQATAEGEHLPVDWALAHCDDGVTWGRYDADAKVWQLGNQVAPDISPPIRHDWLQELRMFGAQGEVLIWRCEDGLRGRVLRDGEAQAFGNASNPLRPSDEARIVRGRMVRRTLDHEFTHVADITGAEQLLPLKVTQEQLQRGSVRLVVRHYFEQNPETGMVRIGATRLVRLETGGSYGA